MSADFWNRGVEQVPFTTGAAKLMDGADIREHAKNLRFSLPFASVLDVGCGTGRLAAFASSYVGADIARDAVAYCVNKGLTATLITGPDDLPDTKAAWVTCLSVFTHIDQPARRAYLEAFATRAPRLLVDIIPGKGDGDVALWTADPAQFEADLAATGWVVKATSERACPSGPMHRFYRCERETKSVGKS